MRMAELSRRSGVSRETIHFYLRQGLLPPPRKVGRNMAWYDDSHVETLALIKRLQQEKFLPLSVIKKLLRGGSVWGGVKDLELAAEVFRSSASAMRPLARAAFCKATGLSDEDLSALEEDGLAAPDVEGAYGAHEQATAEVFKGLIAAGLSSAEARRHMGLCAGHVRALVAEEAQAFMAGLVRGGSPTRATETLSATKELVGRYLAVVREQAMQRLAEGFLEDVWVATSPDRGPRLVLSSAGEDPGATSPEGLFRTGRTEALLAQTEHADDPRSSALRGHALGVTGQLEEGRKLLEEAVEARPDDALIRVLLGRVLLVLARKAKGDPMLLTLTALQELDRSEAGEAEGDDALWAAGVRGRLRAAVPAFFQQREAAVRDLTLALDGLDARSTPSDAGARRLEGLAALTLGSLLGDRSILERAEAVDAAGPIGQQARERMEELG